MARLFPFREARRAPLGVESFSVCEVSTSGAPVRFLMGRLGEQVRPLEEGRSSVARDGWVPSVAADDHGVLAALLEESTRGGPADWEGQGARAWDLGSNGLRRRVDEVLESLEVRPVCAAPEGAMTAVVPLSDRGLRLSPFHRGIRGVATFQPETFLRLVGDYARVYDVEGDLRTPAARVGARTRLASLATGHHAFLLVLPGGVGKILRVRQALELSNIRAVPRNPTLRSVDLVLLQSLVLKTVLGVAEAPEGEDTQVVPLRSFEELVTRVNAGDLQAGFALNPPPSWELRAVIETGQVLPTHTLLLEPLPPLEALRHFQP